VPCEILESRVATHEGDDGATYSIEALYRYEIGGREHRSNRYGFMGGSSSGYDAKAEAVAAIPPGAEVMCWVDPDDPFDAVLERGFTTDYLFGLIPLIFALVGLGGLAFTWYGARAVRKSAAGTGWTAVEEVRASDRVDPSAPLALEPRSGPLVKLGCATFVALLWNGLVSVFVWLLIKELRAGRFDWFLALVVTPFALIGLLLLLGIPYSLLALANPRPRLRLSRSAVPAGGSAQLSWSFEGWASRLDGLRIWLELSRKWTETAVEESGLSVRASVQSKSEVVETIEILRRGGGQPLASGAVSFAVPESARPSSEGVDQSFTWTLKLQGEIDWWPDVMEEYEIRILPPGS
jgi:hypothetical protein